MKNKEGNNRGNNRVTITLLVEMLTYQKVTPEKLASMFFMIFNHIRVTTKKLVVSPNTVKVTHSYPIVTLIVNLFKSYKILTINIINKKGNNGNNSSEKVGDKSFLLKKWGEKVNIIFNCQSIVPIVPLL